ncbi:S8 family peptidase [Portibacter marinus]|uniref:S8 family peptidase n=1 Tax=Portibacter marinus TaxID=2898660 RepID=UPI001F2D5274|nr:S8 family peptidase [Portibacter marinus]
MIRLLTLLVLFFYFITTQAQNRDVIAGEVIVQLEPGYSLDVHLLSRGKVDWNPPKLISKSLNIYLVKHAPELSFEEVAKSISASHKVVAIQPNLKTTLRRAPNDKHYSKQANFQKIDIERAWGVTTGGTTILGDRIVVAVMDSGYGLNLIDLSENHYQNTDESPGDANGDGCPGICGVDDDMDGLIDEDAENRLPSHPLYNPNSANDDDENGYVDDIWGLNLQTYTDTHPADKHGTSVAGIIGAVGNNAEGVSGVNWDVEMMLFSEVSNISQIIEAYEYIYNQRRLYNESGGEKGAYIVVTNFSSGIDQRFGHEFPSWCNMYDKLGSVGVLSVGATTNVTRDVDAEGDLPTTCSSPYLISVTNLNIAREEQPVINGGYGAVNIDLSAPGTGTFTTDLTNTDNVGTFSGTSAATPHVAGAVALIHSIPCENFAAYYKEQPEKVVEIKDYILGAVDPEPGLVGKSISEGNLNIYSTMVALKDFCPTPEGGDLAFKKVYPNPTSTRDEITIEYDGPDGIGAYEFGVFNMQGQLMYTKAIQPPLYGVKEEKIRIPTLAPGVYYFVMNGADQIISHRQVILPY